MATNLHPPDELNFDADDLKNEFKRFKKDLKIFILATDRKNKSSEVKASVLLNVVGRRGRQIFDNFDLGDKLDYEAILTQFEEFCSPKTSESFARYKFFTCRQTDAQNVDKYLTELHTLSNECNFEILKDSLIHDMIVIGTNDSKVQEKLLRETDLNLGRAIQIAKSSEITNKHAAEMKGRNHVDEISQPKEEYTNKFKKNKWKTSKKETPEMILECKFCTYKHVRGKCPAYNKECKRCGKLNHFAKACPSKSINNIDEKNSANELSSDDEGEDGLDALYIGSIENKEIPVDSWTSILELNDTEIELKLDTGAETNVIPLSIFRTLNKKSKILETKTKLKAYNGSEIKVGGKTILYYNQNNRKIPIQFIIVDEQRKPILGLKTCVNLNMIKRMDNENSTLQQDINTVTHDLIYKHPKCFGKIGKLPGTHHITLDTSIKPVIHATRRIPIAIQSQLKKELNDMEKMGIITKTTAPTEWVSSLVVVSKPNGKLRICLDPRDLNKAIKREHYRMMTTEDVLSNMAGANFFTKLDASNAYWQIAVDEESSKILTFNSPFGRYS